jgi:hypothetical protein
VRIPLVSLESKVGGLYKGPHWGYTLTYFFRFSFFHLWKMFLNRIKAPLSGLQVGLCGGHVWIVWVPPGILICHESALS